MAPISFVLLSLCSFLAHATQDCQGNDCPVTVNSLLQVKDKTRSQSKDDVTTGQATTYAEPSHTQGTDGTNSCLAGYSKIDSESDCIAAAGELSIVWKGELPAGQQSSSPGGCLRNANNYAYYNPTSGGDRPDNAPICKETPTTTTTTIAAPTTPMQFVCGLHGRLIDPRGDENPLSSTECDDGSCDLAIAYANQVFFPNGEARLYYQTGGARQILMDGDTTAGIAAANAKMGEAGCHVYFKENNDGLYMSCSEAGVDYKMGHSPYAVRRRAPTDQYPNGWLDYTTAGRSDYSATNMMSCFNNQFLEPMCSNKTGGTSDTYPCKCGYSAKATTVCTAGQLCTAPYFRLSELFSYSNIEGNCEE